MPVFDAMGKVVCRAETFFPVRLVVGKDQQVGLRYETIQIFKCHERLTLVSLTPILTYTTIT